MLIAEVGRLFKFGIVGGAATTVHLATASALLVIYPGFSVFLTNFLAFCSAVPVSFYGHQNFTFQRQGNSKKFFLVAFGGFLINNFFLGIVVTTTHMNGIASITISTLAVPVLIYTASRLWIFR
jgi:putative flippase GtrA